MQGLLLVSTGSDAIFTLGKCYSDANFSVAGMPGTSLEASFLNDDSLLSKDHSYLYPSVSLFDEESCEEPKPLINAGQWFDSTAWKSVPGACNMPDFPGP
jgi:myb proto-oncogene protein